MQCLFQLSLINQFFKFVTELNGSWLYQQQKKKKSKEKIKGFRVKMMARQKWLGGNYNQDFTEQDRR